MIKDAVLLIVVLVTEKNEAQFLHSLLQQKTIFDDLTDNDSDFVVIKLRLVGLGHVHTGTDNVAGGSREGTNEDGRAWRSTWTWGGTKNAAVRLHCHFPLSIMEA